MVHRTFEAESVHSSAASSKPGFLDELESLNSVNSNSKRRVEPAVENKRDGHAENPEPRFPPSTEPVRFFILRETFSLFFESRCLLPCWICLNLAAKDRIRWWVCYLWHQGERHQTWSKNSRLASSETWLLADSKKSLGKHFPSKEKCFPQDSMPDVLLKIPCQMFSSRFRAARTTLACISLSTICIR